MDFPLPLTMVLLMTEEAEKAVPVRDEDEAPRSSGIFVSAKDVRVQGFRSAAMPVRPRRVA